MQPVKVGVIGVGSLGQHHARVYGDMEGCELIGVADVDRRAANRVASQCHTQAFFDYETLISQIDAVSVVVPTVHHAEVATKCLEAGLHTLVEKPITNDVADARALINLADSKSLVLQVGHIERFNKAIERLNEILTKPMFIECHRLGPYDPRVRDVGVVLDLMIHDLDIVLQIVNSPVKTIEAVGVPIISPREDMANARLTFESGAIANLTVSRVTPNRLRKIRIFQPDTYISLDYQKQNMQIFVRETIENAAAGEPKAQIVRRRVRLKKEEPLKLELAHFVDCARDGLKPRVTGEHAHDALELAIEITERLKKHQGEMGFPPNS